MGWFNVYGLMFITFILIPSIIFAIKCNDTFDNKYRNKTIEIIEQIGRFGCLGFMIFNVPGTWFGWWSDEIFAFYLIINAILVAIYCVMWVVLWKKNNVIKALALSIIPSILFLFSGIASRSILLIISSIVFAPAHILISYKNVE